MRSRTARDTGTAAWAATRTTVRTTARSALLNARPGRLREAVRRPSRSKVVKDVVLFCVLAFPVLAGPLVPVRAASAHWWAALAGLAVLAAAIAVNRTWPLAALVVVIGLTSADGNFAFGMPFLSYLTGLRTARTRPVLWWFTTVFVAGSVLNLARGDDVTAWFPLSIWLVLLGVLPWLVGRYWQQYQELLRAGWERADRLEREQRIIAEQERLRERARIAQDMHDSLGHELALIAVRAGALQVSAGLGERHRQAARELRAGAAEATEHLREIIGVLREDAGTGERDGRGARIRPARESIAELVDRARASGVPVHLVDDPADGFPGDPSADSAGERAARVAAELAGEAGSMVSLAAHRVAQEAITNAAKHAPGAAVTVTLARRGTPGDPGTGEDGGDEGRGGVIVVTVVNQAPPAGPPLLPAGGGRGLTGLAERVRLAGGTLRAGPTTAGGFEVAAELPATASAPNAAAGPPAPGAPGRPGEDGEPGEWASESARHLARERRQVRRGLIIAVAVPAGLITVLAAVMIGYFGYVTLNSVLKPGDYAALRVGDAQPEVERVLPPMEVIGVDDVRDRHPEPRGADCRYYHPNANLLGTGEVYRLCFRDGRLAAKGVYRTGTSGTSGKDGE
ncbi:sensor histidine kinase [Actinomadura roseirufa]|uniref:sensor histidine kinase n=1 Tax=Actinomadura roseirufa TaxID=2094049 RepID=UPI001A954513|nr:histidine kinase [Actinomadura roseirufa]